MQAGVFGNTAIDPRLRVGTGAYAAKMILGTDRASFHWATICTDLISPSAAQNNISNAEISDNSPKARSSCLNPGL